MQVSVESVSGLTRRLSVAVPNEQLEAKIQQRLKEVASKAKLDGFRPGKAPLHVIKSKYLGSIKAEVAQGMVEETLPNALQKESLSPVSTPEIEKLEMDGPEFSYVVSFEVLPEIEIKEPEAKTKLAWLESSVKAADVDAMIEKLREQSKQFEPVKRAAKLKDQVKFDFDGSIDGEAIEQGKAKDHQLELGAGQMIPGFEDALVGHKAGESFDIEVTFPTEYHEEKLAGKKATFKIDLHEVSEAKLAEVNEDFVKQYGVASGKLEDLKKDIQANMERELERRLKEINHQACFDVLAEVNPMELPNGLVDKEIEHLKHEMYHRIFGNHHSDNEKIPDFPRELFEDRAKKRVHLGLLFSEYVKKHSFVATAEAVDALIEKNAGAYADPEEFKKQCRADKNWMAEIEAAVVEGMIADKVKAAVKLEAKKVNYQEAMDYQSTQEKKKEG